MKDLHPEARDCVTESTSRWNDANSFHLPPSFLLLSLGSGSIHASMSHGTSRLTLVFSNHAVKMAAATKELWLMRVALFPALLRSKTPQACAIAFPSTRPACSVGLAEPWLGAGCCVCGGGACVAACVAPDDWVCHFGGLAHCLSCHGPISASSQPPSH